MVHGNVYPPKRIEAALSHYFRPGNLTRYVSGPARVADRVEEGLQRYRAEHGIATQWETRERIVVGVAGEKDDERSSGAPRGSRPGRRAAICSGPRGQRRWPGGRGFRRAADRADAVHLARRQLPSATRADVAATLLRFARAENATQMVLGASRRSRFFTLIAGKSIRRSWRAGRNTSTFTWSAAVDGRSRPAFAWALPSLRFCWRRPRGTGQRRRPNPARGLRVARPGDPPVAARGDAPDVPAERGQPAGWRQNGVGPAWRLRRGRRRWGTGPPQGTWGRRLAACQ